MRGRRRRGRRRRDQHLRRARERRQQALRQPRPPRLASSASTRACRSPSAAAWRRRTRTPSSRRPRGSTSSSAPTTWARCRACSSAPATTARRSSRSSSRSRPSRRRCRPSATPATAAGCRSRSAATTPARSASCPRCAARRRTAAPARSSPRSRPSSTTAPSRSPCSARTSTPTASSSATASPSASCCAPPAQIEGLERIRFTSPHPAAFTDDVIDAMAETPAVMPQLHMPLQSGSDRILKAMRRSYRSTKFLGILERVRERRSRTPRSAPTSSSGFPGETEEDFQETLRVVEEARFATAFTFQYSIRPGTPAATMPDQVPKAVVQERYERLVALQDRISWEENQQGHRPRGRGARRQRRGQQGRRHPPPHRRAPRTAGSCTSRCRPAPRLPRPGDVVTVDGHRRPHRSTSSPTPPTAPRCASAAPAPATRGTARRPSPAASPPRRARRRRAAPGRSRSASRRSRARGPTGSARPTVPIYDVDDARTLNAACSVADRRARPAPASPRSRSTSPSGSPRDGSAGRDRQRRRHAALPRHGHRHGEAAASPSGAASRTTCSTCSTCTDEATVAWYQAQARAVDRRHPSRAAPCRSSSAAPGSTSRASSSTSSFPAPTRRSARAARGRTRRARPRHALRAARGRRPGDRARASAPATAAARARARGARAHGRRRTAPRCPTSRCCWHPLAIVGLAADARGARRPRLDARVERMWADGLLDEVRALLPRGLEARRHGQPGDRLRPGARRSSTARCSEAEAIEPTQQLTRRYARRQVSWFKRYPHTHWLDAATADARTPPGAHRRRAARVRTVERVRPAA